MRWASVAVLIGLSALGRCQAPPLNYFVQFTPAIFGMRLPASGANPASYCYVFVHLGGLYDSEAACWVGGVNGSGGVFTGELQTAPAGLGFDGGFRAPGRGFIRWAACNVANDAGCGSLGPAPPAGLTNPMYYTLGAQLGDGTPEQHASGYY